MKKKCVIYLSSFFCITLFSVEFFLHYTFFCRIFCITLFSVEFSCPALILSVEFFFHYTFFCRIFFSLHFFLSNFFFITLFSVEFFLHYTFFCRIFFHYTFFRRVLRLFLAVQGWARQFVLFKKTFINFNKSFFVREHLPIFSGH